MPRPAEMSCQTMIGGVSEATAWPRLPGRNGMSSNRMRRLHSVTPYPLIAVMRYLGDTKRRSLASWPAGAGSVGSEADHTAWSTRGWQQRV